jgi:hypothetical protein
MKEKDLINAKLLKISTTLPNFHQLSPQELQELTSIPLDIWYEFINTNEEVRQFIQRRTNEDIEFAHRKALSALAEEASRGNVQAIKELNNLSGILNQSNNKQIITHYIPRPTQTKKREERIEEIMKEQDWSKEDAEEWYDYNEDTGEENA